MASRAGRRRARDQHRARRADLPLGGARGGETRGGREYVVQQVTGSGATKDYRCPGCGRSVRAGAPHVVVWPVEPSLASSAGVHERRHWHSSCWARGLG